MQYPQTRRRFLFTATGGAAALGAGVILGNHIFADPTQLASRAKDTPESHPLVPALHVGTKALEAMTNIKDYTAEFTKREMIGSKLSDSKMEIKIREKPFSVYLKILKPIAGREALFVDGKFGGKMKAHDVGFAGLAGTLTLDIDGSLAMSDNRYPITMAGMKTMASKVLEQWLEEVQYEDLEVNYYPNARIANVACKAIETSHPKRRGDVKFKMTRLYVEKDRGIPVRVQQYEFPTKSQSKPKLVEDYLYTNIKTNVGLTDRDFSLDNPEYDF